MSQDDSGIGDAALADLLDELVPPRPDGRLPGAGGLGLGAELRRALRERPELRAVVAPGLAALDAIVRARGVARLGELGPAERRLALDALSAQAPALVPTLAFVTFIAYYQDPRVLEALGREPRPPFPKGFELPAGDLSRLEKVRARGPIYRQPWRHAGRV
jgi:hypothetical protein